MPIIERCDVIPRIDALLTQADIASSIVGFIVIEIVQLEQIRHQYGYDVASELVRTVVDQVIQHKREADIVIRISTHELLLVLPNLKSTGLPMLACQRIQKSCAQRFTLRGRQLKPNLKMGISVFPGDAEAAEALLHGADSALVQGRRLKQDIVTAAETRIGYETALLETQYDLGNALENGELFCLFQPKVDLAENRLASVEVLSRWRTANNQMVSPAKFIPVAEANGLITPLTFRCLNESLREFSDLQQVMPNVTIAVNMATSVLREPNLKDIVTEALDIWCVPREKLILEITESALMEDIDESIQIMKGFRELGIGISIDDFGTGHSSLAYLRRLPATELKIDRSFVQSVVQDSHDRQLVQTIVDLAESYGLKTVAEGIEDLPTLECLRDMRCTMAQGFFVAKPMLPKTLPAWLFESDWQESVELAASIGAR